jgi:hypothetical protein
VNKFDLKEYRVKTRQKKLVVHFKDKDEQKRDITIKILVDLSTNFNIVERANCFITYVP